MPYLVMCSGTSTDVISLFRLLLQAVLQSVFQFVLQLVLQPLQQFHLYVFMQSVLQRLLQPLLYHVLLTMLRLAMIMQEAGGVFTHCHEDTLIHNHMCRCPRTTWTWT
ncbi:uncharacterized protein LOC115564088 [Drosophila navojoa]|uniref:uncharacterized protein LOC115564088 n=1 Tax=Drosophila navojoa TaxID=7232 RepID=UPI0011BFAF4B|nr:uncharacterized protein LOC115564088 [Drosophila navojoa]